MQKEINKASVRRCGIDSLEKDIEKLEGLLKGDYGLSKRALAVLLIQEDEEMLALASAKDAESIAAIKMIIAEAKACHHEPLNYIVAVDRQEEASRIARAAVRHLKENGLTFRERLSRITIKPLTGIPILLMVLYFGLYKFVGEFGAGTVVNFIEEDIFQKHINPVMIDMAGKVLPWQVIRDLFVGEFGMLTLGLRYAVAIILPIVGLFFMVFAVIEDSGYLPRLALLIDRVFKRIGLSGRAVIPMVLGLGCDTMATMVTRTLPTKRERLIATILLALAVPCSAQLGVMLSLLEGHRAGLLVWVSVLVAVFLLVGLLSSKVIPGEVPSFYMEIPPLRMPKISNVLIKTYSRIKWYFVEIFPMFIFASFLIWLGQLTGIFKMLTNVIEYPVHWVGLPTRAAVSFLFGFFRRDYGAAGLYDLKEEGIFTGNQLVVACIVLTLFLPCIAQFLMNVKERGLKTGLAISGFVLLFSFSLGYIVNAIFNLVGVHL